MTAWVCISLCFLCYHIFLGCICQHRRLIYELDLSPLWKLCKMCVMLCVGLQCSTESGFHTDRGLLHGTESCALSEEHWGAEGLGWSVSPHCPTPKRKICAHSARAAGEGKWLMAILKPSAPAYYPHSSLYTCFIILSALFSFIIGLWLAISSNTSNSRADILGTH